MKLIVAALLLAGAGQLSAQVGAGSLSGTVLDVTGAVIPGARAVLHNTASGQDREVTSGNGGNFTFAAVPAGDYSLTITRPEFKSYARTGIHLNPGDSLTLDQLQLAVGATNETVTVDSTVGGLPLDNGQLSATISEVELDRLSITGRDATELQRILPGFAIRNTTQTNSAPDFSQVNIGQPTPYASNGAPVAGITLKLDGANLTDAGNFGANLQNINDSFVSEVQVQTSNFGADQSNGPVVISGVTKSGTDKYHGSLYTFARVYQLNSNDALGKASGLARPNDFFVYPGGTVSGPVPHSRKLTFFAGAEYDAQRNVYAYQSAQQAIIHALVPTAAMRAGDFSQATLSQYLGGQTGNGNYTNVATAPTVGFDGTPIANGNIAPYLNANVIKLVNALLPLPNTPGGQTITDSNGTYNYTTEDLIDNNISQFAGRLDYALSPRNTIFGRYTFEKGKQGQPLIPYYSPTGQSVFGAVNTPGGGLINNINVHSASANYVTVFTPTLTNELYGTLMYFTQNFSAKNLSALQRSTYSYGYNGIFDNSSTQLPQFGDYGNDGLPLALTPDLTYGPLYLRKFQPSAGDNLTKVFGKHTVKVGIFSQRVSNNQVITNGASNGQIRNYYFNGAGAPGVSYNGKYPDGSPAYGNVTFFTSGNYLANFFEGETQDYHQDNSLPHTDVYFWNTDFYAQDNWRVTPRLVVNFGVRLEHLGAWTDKNGFGAAIFTPATITLPASATNQLPGISWHAQNANVPNSGTGSTAIFAEPRGGFAFDVFGTGKTVIRGGAGVYRFHDSEADVNNEFQESRGLRTADLQGFGNNLIGGASGTPQGIDSLHLSPTNYGFSGTFGSLPIPVVYGLDPTDNTAPVTNNYSLSLAQQLPKSAILQISYVGNNSNSLLNNGTTQNVVLNNINAIPVGYLFTSTAAGKIDADLGYNYCTPTGCTPQQIQNLSNLKNYQGQPNIQVTRPYPQYSSIVIPRHNTYSNYNGLQVLLQKQTGHLTYAFNYTFSKALGILGSSADFNYTAPVDPFHIYNNYGPLNFDRTQVANFSYSYQFGTLVHERLLGEIANNWLVSGITNIQSGGNLQTGIALTPNFSLNGNIGSGANGYGVSNATILGTPDVSLQPVVKCDPRANLGHHQYINGACFGLPATGSNGQYILPYAHGPAFFTSDLTLEKGFSLGAERRVRLRYAAFNFLNHPLNSFGTNAAQINLNLSDTSANGSPGTATFNPNSGFGVVNSKVGRRLSEFSLKYDF